MKVSDGEGIVTHAGPESCGAARKGSVEALTGERAGRVLSRESNSLRSADAVGVVGRQLFLGVALEDGPDELGCS